MMIDKQHVIEEAKAYCRLQYADLETAFKNPYLRNVYSKRELVEKAADNAFGVIMFVTNTLFNYDETLELSEWWNNDMNKKFWELKYKVISE